MSDRERVVREVFTTLRQAATYSPADPMLDTMAARLVDDILAATGRTFGDRRVWIETDAKNGYVNIKHDGAIMARTKSINAARRIRDALNAPDTLVGQLVEIDDRPYNIDDDGERIYHGEPKPIRGVVMALVPWAGTTGMVLRLPNNSLDTFAIERARIVEPEAPEPTTWEP